MCKFFYHTQTGISCSVLDPAYICLRNSGFSWQIFLCHILLHSCIDHCLNTYGRNLQNMVKDSVLPKVWARMKDIMLTVKTTFTHLPFIYVTLMIQNKTKEETRMNRKVFLTVCSMWNIFVSEIFSMLRMFDNVQKEQFFRSFSTLWVVKINCSHHPAEAFQRMFRCGSPQKDPIVRISFIEFFVGHILRAAEPFLRRSHRNNQRNRTVDLRQHCRNPPSAPVWPRSGKTLTGSGTCGWSRKRCSSRTGCGLRFWRRSFWMENSILRYPEEWHLSLLRW